MRGEEPVIGWESFWVWSSETASQGIRKITAPLPPAGVLESTPCHEWAYIVHAAPGCIAVYVTRGTLPRITARGSKRCKTDPPDSRGFAVSIHPIRSEWFSPLAGEAGETLIFEAANMDQNTLNAMGLRTLPDQPENEIQEPVPEQDPLQGTAAADLNGEDGKDDDWISGGPARHAMRTRQQKRPYPQYNPTPESDSPAQSELETHTAGLERSSLTPQANPPRPVKKIKTEPSPEPEQTPAPAEVPAERWLTLGDGDDELLVRDDGAPPHHQTPNAGTSRLNHTPLPTYGHRGHTVQAPANSSGPTNRIGRAVLSKEEQHAVKLSKMRVELQKARVKVLEGEIELEVLFSRGLGG